MNFFVREPLLDKDGNVIYKEKIDAGRVIAIIYIILCIIFYLIYIINYRKIKNFLRK